MNCLICKKELLETNGFVFCSCKAFYSYDPGPIIAFDEIIVMKNKTLTNFQTFSIELNEIVHYSYKSIEGWEIIEEYKNIEIDCDSMSNEEKYNFLIKFYDNLEFI